MLIKSAIGVLLSLTLAACNSTGVATVTPGTTTKQLTVKKQNWALDTIDSADVATQATLHIADNLKASGSAGCNNFNGQGELDNNRFRIRQMAMTRKLCAPQIMKTEQAVASVLSGWSDIRISGNRLILQNDQHTLVFSAQ